MYIDTFIDHGKRGVCPSCGGTNLSGFNTSHGMSIYHCKNCGGVPSFCNGTVYINRGSDIEINNGDCSNCGERSASARDHAYLPNI